MTPPRPAVPEAPAQAPASAHSLRDGNRTSAARGPAAAQRAADTDGTLRLPQGARVALVHDWLDTWAGGEQVLAELSTLYPGAPIFTLVDFLAAPLRARIAGHDVRTSFVQRLPFARRAFRRYLPLFPRAIESLDVSAFDVVVSTSHAVAKGARTHAGQLHVCYCLSPMRYAWDLREQYLAQVGLDSGLRGAATRRVLDRLARWDVRASARVDDFVAISRHIADRIGRCYGRASTVIYPPVTIPPARATAPREEGLYVTVSRLVPYKHVDTIAKSFSGLPGRRLVIVGDGPERERVAAAAGANVTLAGQLGDEERDALLARAQAFVYAADEDFGIAPLEAQALGTPVIALRKGGLAETIAGLDDDRPTGVFFDEQAPASIAAAVVEFERSRARIDPQACRASASRFSAPRFRNEFSTFVAERYRAFRASAS